MGSCESRGREAEAGNGVHCRALPELEAVLKLKRAGNWKVVRDCVLSDEHVDEC